MDSSTPLAVPFTVDAEGLTLAVRATPKASRNQIGGVVVQADGRAALAIRIAAPPVDGDANTALLAFLAKALGVSKSSVTLRSGQSARLKLVRIAGDGTAIAARLSALIAG